MIIKTTKMRPALYRLGATTRDTGTRKNATQCEINKKNNHVCIRRAEGKPGETGPCNRGEPGAVGGASVETGAAVIGSIGCGGAGAEGSTGVRYAGWWGEP